MASGDVDAELGAKLRELRENPEEMIRMGEVAGVVESLMATLKGDLSSADLKIYTELESLAKYIEAAKKEIVALRPDEVRDEYLPTATDELDAIVEATAEATNTIMDAAEAVESVMKHLEGEDVDVLGEATTKIYEACGFQDITGQRITKVIKALKYIEEKVDALVDAFGAEIENIKKDQPQEEVQKDAKLSDEDLLSGPQQKEKAKNQEEIDALLASFD